MNFLYRLYQLFVAAPLLILITLVTALVTIVGCTLGSAHFWGYWPGHIWARWFMRILLLPVRVEGHEHIDHRTSYVFVANHQGAFDIFLIYGYLGRNFKWMMKQELRQAPLIGKACESAGHIFVDKRGPKAIQRTHDRAREVLQDGTSLVVFPEGERTLTGRMGPFFRGAYQLADELGLPVVPITINGPYRVLSRRRGPVNFVYWHRLSLTLHEPIEPIGKGPENIRHAMDLSREAIASRLEED
ncbi:MAG: 1-acyl-sn-glycerol-3-phosphate acyltransferase [Bacteroidaceae bacterium]|nr:1-acyl-sn-glycerol-3-phosphate acyltransferase [Bacteroidaceae bacterium]